MANEDIKRVLEGDAGEKPDHVVDAGKDATAHDALKVLKSGLKAKASNDNIEIAGQKGIEPLRAYNNLQEALRLVEGYFGKHLKIDLNDIQFRKFRGNMVGESTKNATFVDPIMLMHPAMRLAHVIAHELAHKNKTVMNEGLVEAYVHTWFGHDDAEHGYEEAVGKFKEFAKRCGGETKKTVEMLYGLYYRGEFEKMYEMYEKNHMSKLKTEAEKDQAFKLFREVFPELNYVADDKRAGYFDLAKVA